MNLYQMSDYYRDMLDQINSQDEIQDDVIAALKMVEEDIKEKAVNVAAIIRNLESERDAIQEAAKTMQARYKSIDNKVTWLADFLRSSMELVQVNEIKSPQFDIRIRKNPPSVSVVDECSIPSEYFTVKTETKLDRVMVSEALKEGILIPGVELVQKTRIEIK